MASSFHINSASLIERRLSSNLPPRSNDFTSEYGLKALHKSPVVAYLQRFVSDIVPLQSEDTSLAGSSLPSTAGESPTKPQGTRSDDTAVEEAKQDRGLDPTVLVDGLLSYRQNGACAPLSPQNYHNAFASMYRMSSTELQSKDGAQGTEMLVYFPPLFPRLLESSMIAAENVDRNRIPPNNKRMLLPDPNLAPRKRVKTDKGEYIPACATAASSPVVTEEEALESDAASVLLDLTEDYGLAGIGAICLPRDSALSSALVTIENSSNVLLADAADAVDFVSNEVAEAEERQGLNTPANHSNSVILFVSRKRPRAPMHMLQASHRAHMAMNSNQAWGTNPPPSLVASNGPLYGTGEFESTKKHKKKLLPMSESPVPIVGGPVPSRPPAPIDQQKSSLSHTSMPNGMPNSMQSTKMKDMHRSRLIAASRQTGPGTTLFEATPFRAAAVRLKNKMSIRIGRYCWQPGVSFEVGPGLPLLVSKPPAEGFFRVGQFSVDPDLWTSIVKRLKNGNALTGDEAIEVSLVQKSTLRRSLSAPSRVDFGPFNCGYLSSPSGMTAISPPRPILGVSLPMGVKLPQTAKDQFVPWTKEEEEILRKTVIRFGTNWTIASRALTGLQDVVTVSRQPQVHRSSPRAAKSCREHWQVLARGDPALAREIKKLERTQREKSTMPFSQSPDASMDFSVIEPVVAGDVKAHKPSFLSYAVSSSGGKDSALDGSPDEKPPAQSETVRKRSFSAIAAARKKSQPAPRAIPGMNTDGPMGIAPTHQSHMQSVQSSVSSAWTSGRTEMWPLQFLDTADRYRAQQQAQNSSVSSTQTPKHGVPPSGSRQHSSSSMSRATSAGGRAQSSSSTPKMAMQPQTSIKPVISTPRGNHIPPPTKPAAHKSFAPPQNQQQQAPNSSASSRSNVKETGENPARK